MPPGSVRTTTGHLLPKPGPGGFGGSEQRPDRAALSSPLAYPSRISAGPWQPLASIKGAAWPRPPARPPMALTVQRKAAVCRPARSAPPAHPQHLAAPVQPSRGLPHGCGRRMAGRAAARARLRIREAAQALPFRPAAPPPAAKMAAGRGPSSNHFRFRYGRRGRWRECFPAEEWSWRKCAVLHRRIAVLRLRIRRGCFEYYGHLATPHSNRRPMAGSFVVARDTLAARWRQLGIRTRLRSNLSGTRRDCGRETVRAGYPRWSSVAFAFSTGVVQVAVSRPGGPVSGGPIEWRSDWPG